MFCWGPFCTSRVVLSRWGVAAWTLGEALRQALPDTIGVWVDAFTPLELLALTPLPEAVAPVLVEPLAAVAGALTAVPVLVPVRALSPSTRAPLPMPLPRPPPILDTAPVPPKLPTAPAPTCAGALVATHARLQTAMTIDFFISDRSLFVRRSK